MTKVYLGIDIGTSAAKALAVDSKGKILASASAEYPLHHPKPGWSEQDPHDWWKGAVKTVRLLMKAEGMTKRAVGGIGLSGQMHGSVFLDKSHEVIRPALLWNDQRTAAECREIEDRAGGRRELIRMVANPALTGFTAPKILWLRNHEPAKFARVAKVLLPKDYVRLRLTGELITEVSDASGTLLLDVANRRWSKELLGKLDLDEALLPTCIESEDIGGRLTVAAARELGLEPGVPVVGGGGDQAAGAVGNGIVSRGVISATLGTSGVVFAHSDGVQIDPEGRLHTFCHAVRGKWHMMGVILSAGGSLQWYRNQFGHAEVSAARKRKIDPYEVLCELAAESPPGCEGLYFLPYLTGERTPHADPHAKGAWIGLTPRHDRRHLIRSILEGVAYAMRDSLEIIRGMGVPVNQIRASGGGARSRLWRQMQADVYGSEVTTTNASEGPAYGAALLAAAGCGEYSSVVEACNRAIKTTTRLKPHSKSQQAYAHYYPEFGRLYGSLRENFRAIDALIR